MQVSIQDRDALRAISPAALSAYARAAGWSRGEPYRVYSHFYNGGSLPEIIVPSTDQLADYASVVADLIGVFAEVAERDELTVYRSLVTADRDVVRMRAGENEDGSVALRDGVELIRGAHDMLLAAACSLGEAKSVYRAGANREASELVDGLRLGQTDQGSFVVTLLTPVIPPPMPLLLPESGEPMPPIERRLTMRLVESLTEARTGLERAAAGHEDAFGEVVEHGVSANLCEALVRIIEPFPTLDVDVSWARTRERQPVAVRFGRSDAPLLREVARSFRDRAARSDFQLCAYVHLLTRGEKQEEGTVSLRSRIDEKPRTVQAVLTREDYERAVQAHREKNPVVLEGDLERLGQRWRLLNPRLVEVIQDDAAGDE